MSAPIADHPYRPDRQGQWHTDRCDTCGEPRTAHSNQRKDSAMTADNYPHQSEPGPVTVIGPECFASADASVICWQGVNYYREPDDDELARVFVAMEGITPTEVPGELREAEHPDAVKVRRVIHQCHADIDYYGQSDDPMSMGRVMGVREVLHVLGEGAKADPFDTPDPVCTTCGQPMDAPPCSRSPITGKGGHTHGGGVTGR